MKNTFIDTWFKDIDSTRNSTEGNPIKDSFIMMTGALDLHTIMGSGWNIPDFPGMGAIRMTFFHDEGKKILTYCEGDLTLIECDSQEAYEKEKVAFESFYNSGY